MAARTIGDLAELIRDSYYKSKTEDSVNYPIRYFAELIAIKVAKQATIDAFTNSNAGETTYANNQFITTFRDVAIAENSYGEKYSVLPATPTALPNGQEIVQVRIQGNNCMDCIPLKSQMSFAQNMIGLPPNMILYKVDGKNIVYETSNPLLEGSVTIRMVAAIPNSDVFNFPLNVPKNAEDGIMTEILAMLLPMKNTPVNNPNDQVEL